jgi:hypothetical protein
MDRYQASALSINQRACGSSSLMVWSMRSTTSIRKLSDIVKAFSPPPVSPFITSHTVPSVSVKNLKKNGLTDLPQMRLKARRANRPLPAKRLSFFSWVSCVR